MEVNTANNKMSLSMLPPTEEAGEFPWLHAVFFLRFVSGRVFQDFVFPFVLGVWFFR